MTKTVDFLFLYEIKPRELENICLLKYELEKRGYSVAFMNTWYYLNHKKPKYNVNVLVSHGLHNDIIYNFVRSYVKKVKKIVNMQWEQVLTNADEISKDTFFSFSGMANKVVHISWGEKNKSRLVNQCNIPEDHVKVTGQIALDFFRKEFKGYYLTRNELFEKYKIPTNKKVCLFISSFSYVNLPKSLIQDENVILANDTNQFAFLSIKSQEIIINWFKSIMDSNSNIVFIYRPHPAEANNPELVQLAKQYSNFFVISNCSVKQWIISCDMIYTWISTSLAEIYMSEKMCHILRPINIPVEREQTIFKNAKFITSYKDFVETFQKTKCKFPLDVELLLSHYYIDKNEATYLKIIRVLENVYKTNDFKLPKFNKQKNKSRKSYANIIKNAIGKSFVYTLIKSIALNSKIDISVFNNIREREKVDENDYRYQKQLQNFATEEEINYIINKFKRLLIE
ncbi:MAG: surface carbohydrate biosynthesis protein [Clostridia bacterium]|jgi:surface carbohydrate biosynthesis protein